MEEHIFGDAVIEFKQAAALFEGALKAQLSDVQGKHGSADPEQRWFIEEAIKFILLQKRYIVYAAETHGFSERLTFLDSLINKQMDSLDRLVEEMKKK
jgi:hypothetical protein